MFQDDILEAWAHFWTEVKAANGVRTRTTPGWFWDAYVRLRLDLAKNAGEAADAIATQTSLEKAPTSEWVGMVSHGNHS